AVVPLIPMADEQPVVHPAGSWGLLRNAPTLRSARKIGAICEHFHCEKQAVAGGRDFQSVHIQGEVCDLGCVSSCETQAPYLRAAGAIRKKVQRAAIRRPTGIPIMSSIVGQRSRLTIAFRQIEHPE